MSSTKQSNQIKVYGCPCCGSEAYWTKGNKDVRMNDRVQCLECFLEMEGDYEPQSAVKAWNVRVLENFTKDTVYDINGEIIR